MNDCVRQRVVTALSRLEHPMQHMNATSKGLRTRSIRWNQLRVQRNASSNSGTPKPPKHTVLEKPDTFRPPSHGSRLGSKARSTTASYGSYGSGSYSYAGGYNQGTSEQERAEQQNKRYPNTFPNEGTLMFKFLTNRAIHLWIGLGTLTLLSVITLTQSFVKTSPFAYLLPPLQDLIFHPIRFIRETASAVRLHIDYTTEKTAEERRQNIMDAQKRRLYRRAHGMEDLTKEEGEGIDVSGLVEWDDGLTEPQRRKKAEKLAREKLESGELEVASLDELAESSSQERPQRKKVKRWLGIWE